MTRPAVRKQTEYVPLTRAQFRERFFARFYDPAFDALQSELEKVCEVAWDGYIKYRKSPRKQPAGPGYADPGMALPAEWLATRVAIDAAEKRQKNPASPTRILIVNGSTRSEHSCPGEISKTRRLAQHAQKSIEALPDHEVDFLDISSLLPTSRGFTPHEVRVHVTSAVSLALTRAIPIMPWARPMTGWTKFIRAGRLCTVIHSGCPVHWYQAPASLKLMIDRLVCADGGNPDLTSTRGKDPVLAKALELEGWAYPKHLAGRAFAVVAHGDAAGPENLRRMLADWLTDIGMVQGPGPMARYPDRLV